MGHLIQRYLKHAELLVANELLALQFIILQRLWKVATESCGLEKFCSVQDAFLFDVLHNFLDIFCHI
jgi:hypothetical protein